MTGNLTGVRSHRPHWVYRLQDSRGRDLYIGCASNVGRRISQWVTADWWADVACIDSQIFPDQRAALDAERELIREFDPPHNTVHTPRYDAGGWGGRRQRMEEAHAAGRYCGDAVCGACIVSAHEFRVSCMNRGWIDERACRVCVDYKPFYSRLDEDERRAHPDWEPWWELFLDRRPTFDEVCAANDRPAPVPVSRRRVS